MAITHPQLRRLEQSLGANPNASQVRNFRATVMQHLRDEEREERSMPRKKMTEAEKKAFAAKMKAARAAKGGRRRRSALTMFGVEFKDEAERKAWIANMQAARLKKLGVSAEALAATPAPAKKTKKKPAKKGTFLAQTMATLAKEGSVSSSPRQKKARTKKARKSAKSQKKRAGATLAATIKALAPKRKAPKKRASKKSGKVCFPVGSAAAQAALAAKGRKKSASKKPKKAKKSKKAAPKQAIRKVEGFVFPHASGSERKCVKCGRLHSLREHWSHKYMHATARTKHSYLCKRGGFCAFENLSKRDLAQALKIESERSKSKKRQAELALKYYKLMGKVR